MKIVRYTVGIVGFFLVWFLVAVIVGMIMAIFFQRPNQQLIFAGIGLDWRNIPGTILGLLAGIHSFRASIKRRNGK